MNAIRLLRKDHRTVEQLFRQLGRLTGRTTRGAKRRKELARTIVRELSTHAAIEEHELYPKIRETLPGGESMADEGLEEHQQVKEILARLDQGDPESAAFRKDFSRLVESVRHHVKEEESGMFRTLERRLGREELSDLGKRLEHARMVAPTHPHPSAPNRPPANIVANLAAGFVDRVRDAVGSVLPATAAPARKRARNKRRKPAERAGSRRRSARGRGRGAAATSAGRGNDRKTPRRRRSGTASTRKRRGVPASSRRRKKARR